MTRKLTMAKTVSFFVLMVVLVSSVSSAATGISDSQEIYKLPEGLLIGAGASALQTEGAWNTHGKSESAADHLLHMESLKSMFPENPDTAANTYERFKDDVAMAKKLKLQMYRLSFSWSRLLPEGNASQFNQEGIDFYKAYLQEIIDSGMVPFVTLYHFDHPQVLQEQFNGWESRLMVDKFEEYARFAFETFGSQVKLWGTMNEPNFYCMYFSMLFRMSGEVNSKDLDSLRCMQNFVLAHMKAYHLYHNEFAHYKGQVGTTAVIFHGEPASKKPEDIFASEVWNEAHFGQVMHPIVFGDHSDLLKRVLGDKLPKYTDSEKVLLKNCTDFLGINVYNGIVVSYTSDPRKAEGSPIFSIIMPGVDFVHFDTPFTMDFTKITPEIMKRGTLWTWERYGRPIIIAENGYGGPDATIHDDFRLNYHSAYLQNLVSTIKTFKVDVLAYTVWSLIDCYEWSAGYSRVFGLVHVDYEGGSLDRTLKDSSKFFIELAETRIVPSVSPTTQPGNGSSSQMAPSALLAFLCWCLAIRKLQ